MCKNLCSEWLLLLVLISVVFKHAIYFVTYLSYQLLSPLTSRYIHFTNEGTKILRGEEQQR